MTPDRTLAGHGSVALLLGAMLFLGSAYFFQEPEWNGNSRLNPTRAIVERASPSNDDFHDAPGWSTGDKALFRGHYYSDKAIASSILAVPPYFLVHKLAALLGLPLDADLIKHILTTCVTGGLFTIAGISMYTIAIRVAADVCLAFLATIGKAFGTTLWPYCAVFYGHVPAAAFLILTFGLLVANMLDPPMGKIKFTKLEFRPDRGGFHVDRSLFHGFSFMYGCGLVEVSRLQRAGQSPWTLGSAVGLSIWSSVGTLLPAQMTLLLGVRRQILGFLKNPRQTAFMVGSTGVPTGAVPLHADLGS